jgi:long-chain acyl-CoA synthetase
VLTSGTSNVPKGIRIGYAGLLGNGARMAEHLGLDRDSRFYNVLSLSYLGGVFNLTLVPVLAGGSVVLDGALGATNVYGFWETVREHGVNTLWFSPTMLAMLLALDDEEDLSFLRTQVRVAMCGMAPLPADLKKRFEERFGFALQENYALSETGFVTVTRPGAPGKPGAVGGPLTGVEVRILDGDLRPLGHGREGQIAVRSDYLMLGYDVPEGGEGKAPMHGDFFLTGDVGYRDEDGDLYVTGRLKDIIIRGGVNISPKMIEDTVYRMEPVQEAAVVGVPHPMYGEEVALVVKLREASRERVTVDDVRRFCELHIAHFQRPKYIFSIDELPKGVTGKIQKNVLKRLLADRLDPLNG